MSNESFPAPHLENLWAPWRVEYFSAPRESNANFLSEAAQTSDDAAHFVVTRGKCSFLIMNKYPYSAGHLMVAPYRKVADLSELTPDEVMETWKLSVLAQQLLRTCVRAQGFNVGWNLGQAGGAGVEDHLHLHIVPRWAGDANFMTVIGGARVIPEGLQPLYDRLMAEQAKLS